VTFVGDAVTAVRDLKRTDDEKPLWLWGGGELFRSLAEADLVDEVEVAIIPVVLGDGLPLMAPNGPRLSLELTAQRTYQKTGILHLKYRIILNRPQPPSPIAER
jgi:dihydrofolate reductase